MGCRVSKEDGDHFGRRGHEDQRDRPRSGHGELDLEVGNSKIKYEQLHTHLDDIVGLLSPFGESHIALTRGTYAERSR